MCASLGSLGDRCCSDADCSLVSGRHLCGAAGRCACLDGLRSVLNACLLDPTRGHFTDRVAGMPYQRTHLGSTSVASVQRCRRLCLRAPGCLALLFVSLTGLCELFSGVSVPHAGLLKRPPGFEVFLFRPEPHPGEGFHDDGHGRYFKYLPQLMTAHDAHAACAELSAILYPALNASDMQYVFALLNLTAEQEPTTEPTPEYVPSTIPEYGLDTTPGYGLRMTAEPELVSAAHGVHVGLDRLFHLQQLHAVYPVVAVSEMPHAWQDSELVHRHDTPLYSSDGRTVLDAPWRRGAPLAFDFIAADLRAQPPQLLDVPDSALLPAVCQHVPGRLGTFLPDGDAANATVELPAPYVYQLHGVLVTGGADLPRAVTVTGSLHRARAGHRCAASEALLAPPPGLGRLLTCSDVIFARFVHLHYAEDPLGGLIRWPPVSVYGTIVDGK